MMKAVILAAGKGFRMRPLSQTTPKPLLKVNGRPIIDYILESFPPEITEVIIVVKYLGYKIKKHIGTKNRGRKIRYVLGSNKGSAYSFLASKRYLKDERFLFVYGDELIDSVDVANCLKKDLSILVFEPENSSVCGMAYLRGDGTIRRIAEKPKKTKSKMAVNGLMVINTNIFNYKPQLLKSEFYFSTMLSQFANDHKVFPVKAKRSIFDITTLSDLVRAEKILAARYNGVKK